MSNYYKEKRNAQAEIKTLASKKTSFEDIAFFILEKYGFSKKMVLEYYNLLAERGFIENG